jgi:hypothetical protein
MSISLKPENLQGYKDVASLVLAVLIVGTAPMMQVPTPFRIFGYPGLPMIVFLVAAAGGTALFGSVVVNDRRQNLKARPAPSRSKLA